MDSIKSINTKTFTRVELQQLKAKLEDDQIKSEIDSTVKRIRCEIISSASLGKTSHYKSIHLPENKEDRMYRIIMSTIDELHTHFPGVDIKYDFQTCIRTGKKMNQGIYVDWS